MDNIGKGLASLAVCALGAYCMYLTDGRTGVGWAIVGLTAKIKQRA